MNSEPLHLRAHSCPALESAYRYSCMQLEQLITLFAVRPERLAGMETIAVGGSLGRLEATPASDIDCIMVLCPGTSPRDGKRLAAEVHQILIGSPLRAPKPDGIYRQALSMEALLDRTALGSLSEAPEVFGKRMQLLLDARPVFGFDQFERARRAVIDWYAADFVATAPERGWTFLQNDLMRYLHSYAGWQQFKFARSADDSWQLRQAKLRTSRLLTFAALLFLLGESARDGDKQAWLVTRLSMTPLQRLHAVMGCYDANAYARLLAVYDTAFALLTDTTVRAELVAGGPDADTRMTADVSKVYARIKAVSSEISYLLTSFALARREDWGMRFFERWLF